MYTIAVCDDDKTQMSSLIQMIQGLDLTFSFEVDGFESWEALLKTIEKRQYDVVLLDILWGSEPKGIQAALRINECSPDTQIIFVTGYFEQATEVYEARHFYFILKTQLHERLPDVLHKVVQLIDGKSDRLMVKQKSDTFFIPYHKILYMERNLHTTILHCSESQKYKVGKALSEFEAQLPETQFLRCHNSFMVNKLHISTIRRTQIMIDDGTVLSISRKYWQAIQNYLASALDNSL